MPMALEGIRILDLSRLAPGPYCSMILGDLGAEVIRVESADPRARVEGWIGLNSEQVAKFRAYNPTCRNKKSIVLDLKQQAGRDVFYKLAATADVILEEFRPGVVKKLGVDYETIKKINHEIVYCSLTGYGQEGPYRDLPGHDINYISLAGVLSETKDEKGRPAIPSNLVADLAGGGMHAAMSILAALVSRSLHGKGQYVESAMSDAVVNLMHFAQVWRLMSDKLKLFSTRKTGFIGMPFCNVYQTRDGGWISLAVVEPWFWANFCKALNREDLIPVQFDPDRQSEIEQFLKQTFMQKDRDEWFAFFKDKEVCIAPVYSLQEVEKDPHIRARQMFLDLDHPDFGPIRQVGISAKLSETPGSIRDLGSLPGQDTDWLLESLGYSTDDVATLRQERVVE